jgi:hypothetical protein
MTPGRKKGTPKTGGRRKATPDRKTIEQIEASGLTPLDHMLAVIRDPKAKPERRDEMAKAAAPYVHPPLGAIGVDTLRWIGTLLAEIVKFDGGSGKCPT